MLSENCNIQNDIIYMKLKNLNPSYLENTHICNKTERERQENDKHTFRIMLTLREEVKGQDWGRSHKGIVMIYFK